MAYEWQTIDIVPDDIRDIEIWISVEPDTNILDNYATGFVCVGMYESKYVLFEFHHQQRYPGIHTATHWRDVKPPE